MTVSTESWVIQQRQIFRFRRHFMRDILFDKLVRTVFWDVKIEGLENIPPEGPAILMINHVTAADPVAVLGATRPRFVVPMSKIENFWNPFSSILVRSWGAYPVRRGTVDREALRIAEKLLEAGELTLIAPEGTRHPALGRPRHGLTYIAVRTNAIVVPTAIYNLETWLKDLVIPWRRTEVHVHYGRPFRLKKGGRKRIPRAELHRMTDEMMYQLAALLPERNRGEYADLSRATTDYLEFVNL